MPWDPNLAAWLKARTSGPEKRIHRNRNDAGRSKGFEETAAIQKLLGHASLETTAIYTEMSVEALRRVYSACHPAERRWRERHA